MHSTQCIFNHIPKTGGISLLAVCRSNLAPSDISPHLTDGELRLSSVQRFERFKLIAGHFSISAQAKFSPNRYSMTLLREPIRRIFSTYTFWRSARESTHVTEAAKQLSFADFVRYFRDSPCLIHNNYLYHFADIRKDVAGYSSNETSLLTAAKHNLAQFNFIGISEYLERSARLLCTELQWQVPQPFPHDNATGSEAALNTIDPETLAILRSQNHLDRQLYDYALEQFWERERNGGRRRLVPKQHFVTGCPTPDPPRRAAIQKVTTRWLSRSDIPQLEVGVEFNTISVVPELILGIAFYRVDGTEVWGTNTAMEGVYLKYEVGFTSRAAFTLLARIPAAKYHITVALSQARMLGFHEHWMDHATAFEVAAESSCSTTLLIKVLEFTCRVDREVDGSAAVANDGVSLLE